MSATLTFNRADDHDLNPCEWHRGCYREAEYPITVPDVLRRPGGPVELYLCDAHAQLQDERHQEEVEARLAAANERMRELINEMQSTADREVAYRQEYSTWIDAGAPDRRAVERRTMKVGR